MEKVLITGGSGFIGKEIAQVLLEKGFEVNVLDLNPSEMEGVTLFRGSVLDMEAISKAILGCTYVVHMAAILGVSKSAYAPVECLDVNIFGTRNVLKSCVIHGVKKILLPSSSEVYGEPQKIPIEESDSLAPKSEYGVSKSVCEEYLKAYKKQHGLDFTIVRYFNVYGEEQRHSWVMAKFVNNAVLGKSLKVFGDGSQVRAFCHVWDAALGTVTALLSEEANGHVFNIGNQKGVISMKDLATKVVEISGGNARLEMVPLEQSDRSKDREIFRRVPSTNKAKELLNFEASIHVDDGIRRVVEFKRNNLEMVKADVESAESYENMVNENKCK
jgi:UDP-glucose 4-epimerase